MYGIGAKVWVGDIRNGAKMITGCANGCTRIVYTWVCMILSTLAFWYIDGLVCLCVDVFVCECVCTDM